MHFNILHLKCDIIILIKSDIKTHFRIINNKYAQVILQIRLHYNFISVSLEFSVIDMLLIDLNYAQYEIHLFFIINNFS